MPTASWDHLERAIERLHAAAREPIGVREFYRLVVDEAVTTLDAAGGAAWRPGAGGRPELICQKLPDDGFEHDWSARLSTIKTQLTGGAAGLFDHDAEHETLACAVNQPTGVGDSAAPVAVLELLLPRGASPPVRQGWLDFVAALVDVAADFHARDELRRLRGASALRGQAVELIRRVSAARSLTGAAFAAVNEGRRLLECDRVSVFVRRGGQLRLLATSGVDRVTRDTDFARNSERLAGEIAAWGEPVEHSTSVDDESPDLPPPLAMALEAHIDHAHARELGGVPLRFAERDATTEVARFDAVVIAERFVPGPSLRASLTEFGELCAPALARSAQLERFPVGAALRWSERLARLRAPAQLSKALVIAALVAGVFAALVFVPATLRVEAPARLATAVEREVFATASGAVSEVRVTHGQHVAQGDELIVLSDPELELKLQEVRGEMAATQQRLDALAVTRTDRTLREESAEDRLPMAAEQLQLDERLASLQRQEELLAARQEALTLRSPCSGEVLTRDVQSLLAARPVERGQALLTIADASSGWELHADVPQRQIGHVVAASESQDAPVAVSFRLASDVQATHSGHLSSISAAAPLDADGLRDEPAPVEVRIAVDGPPPAAARPGMAAQVSIDCGRRSLGYVWLHDVAATLYRWATF